ncbi:MAG: hypothetical protein KME21_29755 [Desmonostoc vinosum HA7617-LM4]|jgi:hypothetical protein|nr:hypothetical protein [Desmonostoc vinosum HA7617-LM4]
MNIAKLILFACPVFIASMVLVANPANASSMQSPSTTQVVVVAFAQPTHELAAPTLNQTSNPILDQLGCNCANCIQTKFQMLQGKLPSAGF